MNISARQLRKLIREALTDMAKADYVDYDLDYVGI